MIVLPNEPSGDDAAIYFLHPGSLFAARRRYRVTTVLGSCVSVCLYDPEEQVGGANHFVLPFSEKPAGSEYLRFGNHAVPALIRAMQRHGAQPGNLVAKVFGGAALFQDWTAHSIGRDNVAAAYAVLAEHDIPIVAEDVGGHLGRKLVFDTSAGTAFVKRL